MNVSVLDSCELISNCIFTWGFTSSKWHEHTLWLLWIDFKLYFYVRIHKRRLIFKRRLRVVNWFQIVFLREDSQVNLPQEKTRTSCELISNCIFTWGFTSFGLIPTLLLGLWIDFKLYFYVRIHKPFFAFALLRLVVNWFQIVFLREDSQAYLLIYLLRVCCELISNCIFTWGFTRNFASAFDPYLLWIDFKLYFYVRIHKYPRA